MNENSHPIAALYGFRGDRNELVFVGRHGLIALRGAAKKIDRILRLCNGMTSVSEIAEELSEIPYEEVLELLLICEEYGVVHESRELYLGFHEDSSNPQMFARDLSSDDVSHLMRAPRLRERDGPVYELPSHTDSEFLEMLRRRQSVRQFVASRIPLQTLSGLLQAAYGVGRDGHWSVPSGGSIYPLDIYLVIADSLELPHGIYRWRPESRDLIQTSEENPTLWLGKVFNAKTTLEHAGGIICIVANLERMAAKYANRGYRLALLEAGHVAQNAYAFCTEQGLGAVEFCGFEDESLAARLGLQFPQESVLSTIVFGVPHLGDHPLSFDDRSLAETAERLRHALVGPGKPISDVSLVKLSVKDYVMPEWAATAVYRTSSRRPSAYERRRNRAFGTGTTSHEALVKVLAEAHERYALEHWHSDLNASVNDLDRPFIDPRTFVPYNDSQLELLRGLSRFDPEQNIGWVLGTRETGESVWVPTDLVYYDTGRQRDKKPFYCASSSGVAAHFDREIAVKTALYELIERDAFCVTWYARRHVNAIPHRLLTNAMQSRISSWERLGYHVSVLNLTLDGPPVVLVMIFSREKTPALCSGASCRPRLLDATERAFSEAEFMAMSWHRRRPRPAMKPSDIQNPADHGLFYIDPRNLVHADWLLEAREHPVLPSDFSGRLPDYAPVVVDLTPSSDKVCGLKVVRVLSERLMPMNFGYGTEHSGHQRMRTLDFEWSLEYPSIPHFFA